MRRRSFLALPAAAALAACTHKRSAGFPGYAFVANQEGEGLAAVDLQVMAVARHIPLGAAPSSVIAGQVKPSVYALTPDAGAVHDIQVYRLAAARKAVVASSAIAIRLSFDEKYLYVLAREPRAMIAVALDSFHPEWQVSLPEEPADFAFDSSGAHAAVTSSRGLWMVDLQARRVSAPLMEGEFGAAHFRWDNKILLAANLARRALSVFDVPSGRLMTHLPLAMRPDQMCVSRDLGQLFVTGEGRDAVAIVYPSQTEVAETVLAGHAPGALAASESRVFIANPGSGDVSILDLANAYKIIAVVQTGTDPGFITVTPDDQYALVLNRKSGDMAVLRIAGITPNPRKSASVFTVIPVGSKPVSAAVRGV